MNSASEPGLSKDGMPHKSIRVIEAAEVAVNMQNSSTEAELQKHGESDGPVEVTDSTEDERVLGPSFSKASELCKDDKCVELVRGNGEAEREAPQYEFSVHSELRKSCRSWVTEQGNDRTKVDEEISLLSRPKTTRTQQRFAILHQRLAEIRSGL